MRTAAPRARRAGGPRRTAARRRPARRGERRGAGPAAPRRHLGPVGVTKEEFLAAEKARVEAESREAASRGRLVRQLSHNTYERYIALQRVRAACWRGAARLYNWTIGVLTLGASRYDLAALSAEALIPINAASLVDELLSVTAHQARRCGGRRAERRGGGEAAPPLAAVSRCSSTAASTPTRTRATSSTWTRSTRQSWG